MLQDDKFNSDVASIYKQQQPFQNVPHPPVLLSFSAIPGSGKTTLAKKLFHDLQTQYINHDDIRNIIRKRGINPEEVFMPPISRIVINNMVKHDKNKFVVLDVSLDRRWDIFFDHAKELRATTVVVRLDIPTEVICERLRSRDGDNSVLLSQIDRFKAEFDNCRQNVTADITIGENYNYQQVLQAIRNKLP